jgi:hypothetical protein
MTMGCARCHDHKYDPITQRDFYRFFAFFNAVPEKGLDGAAGNAAPMLQLPTKLEKKELEKVKREIVRTKRKLQVLSVNGKPPAFRSWEDTVNLPPRSRVRIVWKADDRVGEWMYHCHILEHHLSGMMAHFAVVP